MVISEHYQALLQKSSEALKSMQKDSDCISIFVKVHNLSDDYASISKVISDRPEFQMFDLAICEYQHGLDALACGRYRHATISLRLFFELALATILFSAYEIRLRKWLANSQDIVWSSLVNPENGVFSKTFIEAFNSGLEGFGKQYATIAEKVYRECSEFVHGNIHTHSSAKQPIGFSKEMLTSWAERAEAIHLCIVFAFTARYIQYVADESKRGIEGIVIENLGHLSPIQDVYGR